MFELARRGAWPRGAWSSPRRTLTCQQPPAAASSHPHPLRRFGLCRPRQQVHCNETAMAIRLLNKYEGPTGTPRPRAPPPVPPRPLRGHTPSAPAGRSGALRPGGGPLAGARETREGDGCRADARTRRRSARLCTPARAPEAPISWRRDCWRAGTAGPTSDLLSWVSMWAISDSTTLCTTTAESVRASVRPMAICACATC